MRNSLLFFALLFSTAWVVAQTSPDQSNSPQTSNATSQAIASGQNKIQGCINGSNGNYTLTDRNGTTYQLTGDTAQLNKHVGHEVQLTGSQASASASAASSGQAGSSGQASFNVTRVKHISKTCSNTGSSRR